MAERPGALIYFDVIPALDELSDSQAGRLFRAVMKYAKDGETPDIEDQMVRLVWATMKKSLDRDAERYATLCTKNSYRVYTRWAKEKGDAVLPYDEWYTSVYQRIPAYTNYTNTTQHNPTQPNTTQLNSTQQERKGVQGETQTGAILHEIPQPYRPPDAGEWERLKAEQTAKLREVKLE